ncbi:MAG: DNA primase, partial [Clostridia bacterium]|nr:DNA primase [Clostridia bacterium]
MALPVAFIEDLKYRNDIAEIISNYVSLKKRGRNLVGLCPFHAEKTASFNVYPTTESFYCFGCGVGGDVITFIEKIENLDYIEAVKLLAQRVNLTLPETDGKEEQLANLRRKIFEINREAARFFHSQLYEKAGEKSLEYLKKRGLSPQVIRHFGLGYSPPDKFLLIDYLKNKGFTAFEMTQANLAMKSNYGKIYARFSNRIMFPILDLRGNVIAFGGRATSDIKPKYLNTSDTVVFKKSANLFALNFAKNYCAEYMILVEGYMDVIALHSVGFQNTVATLGTALTLEQAQAISKYSKEVIICYDSDEAGQKASARAIDIFRKT